MPTNRAEAPTALLTAREVERLIRVDRSTIYRMAADGRLPAVKIGRQWRFPADAIERRLRADHPGPADGFVAEAQRLVDLFADLGGVTAVLTDLAGRPVTRPSNPSGYLTALATRPRGLERCIADWRALATREDPEPALRLGLLGLRRARAFVGPDGRPDAMVIAGCVAPASWPPPRAELEALATDVGVDTDELATAAVDLHRLDPADEPRLLEGLARLAAHLTRLAAAWGVTITPAAIAATDPRSTP